MNTLFVCYIERGSTIPLWRVARQKPGAGEYLDIEHVLDYIRHHGWTQ